MVFKQNTGRVLHSSIYCGPCQWIWKGNFFTKILLKYSHTKHVDTNIFQNVRWCECRVIDGRAFIRISSLQRTQALGCQISRLSLTVVDEIEIGKNKYSLIWWLELELDNIAQLLCIFVYFIFQSGYNIVHFTLAIKGKHSK